MSTKTKKSANIDFEMLNKDIAQFPQVHPITKDMKLTHEGDTRMGMLYRHEFKITLIKNLIEGDFVVLTIKTDSKFPVRGYGYIIAIDRTNGGAYIKVETDFLSI